MSHITIKMKDGSVKEFKHQGRPGGSYSKKVSYEGAFVVVTDEWGKQTAIPAQDVAMVVSTPDRW